MKKIIYELYTLVLAIILRARRRTKIGDLRRHILMIVDPEGCDRACEHLDECRHIVEHYRIKLSEAGFDSGLPALRNEMYASLQRAMLRKANSISGFCLQFL
ncbi:MAG: hypothetical protein WCS89_01505 [Candidatus Paceibacterota bacterium]|jgi:hypothetical protein